MTSPIIQASYEANTFHATLVTTDNRHSCAFHKVRAEKTHLHPCSLEPHAGLLQLKKGQGTCPTVACWGSSWRSLEVCTQAPVGIPSGPKELRGTRVLGQEAELSSSQWGSRRRGTSHLACSSQGLHPLSSYCMLGWAPYPSYLHDLLCGPWVLEAQDSLYFLEAPFSLEGPVSLWALALWEDERNMMR